MDRRTVLAVLLCFGIYMGWQKLYLEPRMPPPKAQTAAQTAAANSANGGAESSQAASSTGSPENNPALLQSKKPLRPEQTRTLETATGTAKLGDDGDVLTGWTLKGYRVAIEPGAPAVHLGYVTNSPHEIALAFDDPSLAYLSKIQGDFVNTPGNNSALRWTYEDANVRMTRDVTGTEQSGALDLKINVEFKKQHPNYAFLSVTSATEEKDPEERDRQLLLFANQSLQRVSVKKASLKEIITPVKYIAAQNRYFLLALLNESPVEPKGLIQQIDPMTARASLVYPVTSNSITIPAKVYFGPKELDMLRSVDPALDKTVDFGMFTVIALPILAFMKWLYTDLFHNYGVAIIFLTVLLKLATFPLSYKSTKSMKEMAKIQPQLARVRERYKDDREALNREMLTLMRSHGYNPMAGCLPMLIPIPVFFALYRVLYSAIELYHAPFAFWIRDLSARDPFYVTPVLMSALMFFQQKLTPSTATDPTQAKMMQMMPVFFGLFMLALPSGLTLYMLVNSLVTILQQLFLNKKLGVRLGGVPAQSH